MANIVDIEEIVQAWAWTNFLKTRPKEQAKIKYEDVTMNVNWSRVRFVTSAPNYEDKIMTELPKAQVVFKSTFRNDTDSEQEHSFQTERTTSCVSTTTMTKGFTKGFNVELKLGLPEEVAEITAGFGREVSMETGFEDTCEESITWAVDSTIKVKPKHITTAEMVVKEKEFNANYRLTVKIRGIVIVSILNKRDNNSFVVSVEGDFCQIMKDEQKRGSEGFHIEDRTVIWELTGKCKFRFGVEQQVKITECEIE
ncbi:hypothetical protein FSP39_011941 [Pinctada imbricata]|uniref:Uncharacterized protein n=1 Tax=Pinctada imbricata TaxID=66713 RepID=A0AA88YJJ4_PINIB|nr:hypothetical protein FSP39_011941 [Pinctada imbricata]